MCSPSKNVRSKVHDRSTSSVVSSADLPVLSAIEKPDLISIEGSLVVIYVFKINLLKSELDLDEATVHSNM